MSAGGVLRSLQERGLIEVVGRSEALGRPLLYGTTPMLLELLGLRDLADLPRAEELTIALRPHRPTPGERRRRGGLRGGRVVSEMRLQRALARAGVASRRAAEKLIEDGRVRVDGQVATLGMKVDPDRQRITVGGRTRQAGRPGAGSPSTSRSASSRPRATRPAAARCSTSSPIPPGSPTSAGST